jgi:hypothetical protein
MLMLLEIIPPLTIFRFGMEGGAGQALGSPSSQVSVIVTASPTFTVSRSNETVKFAARSAAGAHQATAASKSRTHRSVMQLRLRSFNLFRDISLRIDAFVHSCL